MNTQGTTRVLIERVTPQDVDRLLRIEQNSFSAPWTRKMFEVELNGNPFSYLFAARSIYDGHAPGEIVGYICFWVVFDELRVMNLAVEPSVRRQGIASELVQYMLAFGRAQGAARAILEVRASNLAACGLYEQMGFRQTAVRTKYYTNPTEDAILMEMNPLVVAQGEQ
ncbi:MAG TPA: ribosomal protein S18-alanine N-acetyltransferase [Nitrospiraceae bacterium]|nr:ribosomal protein S18-alanine N-acetyltransferase [Nitrospiraceae bacterium]